MLINNVRAALHLFHAACDCPVCAFSFLPLLCLRYSNKMDTITDYFVCN